MSRFFTSDTHFQHRGKPVEQNGSGGVIVMSKRPFATIEEHDEELIRRWNAKVGPKDEVFHCGDFALGNQENISQIVSRLNGRIHLILGNHDDEKIIRKANCFESVQDVKIVRFNKMTSVFLSHYAHRVWPKSHYGRFHFYGHSHGHTAPIARSLDVGVDCWNYEPVTLAEIIDRLETLNLHNTVVKHHGVSHV